MKLESWHTAEERARFKAVRTDDYTDIAESLPPWEIISADESTGELQVRHTGTGETKNLSRGEGGLRLCLRRR